MRQSVTVDSRPNEMECQFESAVLKAHDVAKRARDAGFPHYRACDEIYTALAELWEEGRHAGMSDEAIQAIADKYVEFDVDGDAWPREQATMVH